MWLMRLELRRYVRKKLDNGNLWKAADDAAFLATLCGEAQKSNYCFNDNGLPF